MQGGAVAVLYGPTASGKSDLAVQTGDGVKEPLNRRSTIHIQF